MEHRQPVAKCRQTLCWDAYVVFRKHFPTVNVGHRRRRLVEGSRVACFEVFGARVKSAGSPLNEAEQVPEILFALRLYERLYFRFG